MYDRLSANEGLSANHQTTNGFGPNNTQVIITSSNNDEDTTKADEHSIGLVKLADRQEHLSKRLLSASDDPDKTINDDDNEHENTQLQIPPEDNDERRSKQLAVPPAPPNISDLIGEFGLYQLSLALATLIRYICVAMMTNTGPLLAPSLDHYCKPEFLPSELPASYNTTTGALLRQLSVDSARDASHRGHASDDFFKNKCQFELASGQLYTCSAWSFETHTTGVTLTDSFSLVCDRSWLKSAFQSSVSFGVMIASVLFGSFSDEHGRRLTMLVSCVISLCAGLISCWAPNFLTYTLARALATMCDLGIVNSLYTTVVETLGNKYRGAVCLIVFTGWSLGVMVMPWITSYFMNFRHVMLFTVACHALTLPWLASIGESVRWLLVNGRISEARAEMRRIVRWNSLCKKTKQKLNESNFELLSVKYEQMARERADAIRASGKLAAYNSRRQVLKRTLFGGLSKVGQIFASRELTITTIMIIWTTFNSELLYMLFVMINSDVGENVKLNYAIGGLVETLATLLSIFMISWLSRRLSLCATLSVISSSMFCLAFTHAAPLASVWTLNFTKLAISTLSSLVYVVVTELFPTSLRQTGMGLAGTLGSLGAVIAPFIRTELVDAIGMTQVMLALCLLPLSAAALIPFFLRETQGVELADNVNEIDNEGGEANLTARTEQQVVKR